jgi:hypothetical protein
MNYVNYEELNRQRNEQDRKKQNKFSDYPEGKEDKNTHSQGSVNYSELLEDEIPKD